MRYISNFVHFIIVTSSLLIVSVQYHKLMQYDDQTAEILQLISFNQGKSSQLFRNTCDFILFCFYMCIQAHPRKCFVVFVLYTMAILENWKCYNLSHFNFDIICHFRIWCSVKFLTNWATGQTAGRLFATYLKVYHVTWFKLFFFFTFQIFE